LSEALDRARDALRTRLASRLSGAASEWLDAAGGEIARDPAALFRFFPAAGRKLGRGPLLEPAAAHAVRLFPAAGPLLNPWQVEEAGRVLLLLESERGVDQAKDLYDHGSGGERVAVVRGLQLFLESEAGLPCVRDALRANAVDLFAAAICENLYASRHLPDASFFQAVLKCVFVGLRVDRVENIEERCTPELSRMLFAYATEREQAGRPIAAEIWPLIALHPPARARERIAALLGDATGDERRLLEVALARAER